jgi:choline transport protein
VLILTIVTSIISFLGSILLGLSLAELSSSFPTAGGQYHWVAALAPPREKATASWYTGWISIGGQIMLTASAGFVGGSQLQALITVNNPAYVGQRWQSMLFYWAILAYSLAVNAWGSRLLSGINLGAGVLHVAGFVVVVCVLGAMASPKHTAEYVFVETSNQSGWQSDGISWLVGLTSSVYPFLG